MKPSLSYCNNYLGTQAKQEAPKELYQLQQVLLKLAHRLHHLPIILMVAQLDLLMDVGETVMKRWKSIEKPQIDLFH